jgi:hypothetical protein
VAEEYQTGTADYAKGQDQSQSLGARLAALDSSIKHLQLADTEFGTMSGSPPPDLVQEFATLARIRLDSVLLTERDLRAKAKVAIQSYIASRCNVAFPMDRFIP